DYYCYSTANSGDYSLF
nr:immunoglobulin light chain junction region [Macaca mulatta]MOW03582.1 immunoglobulin light chain junction region [Macaca mulatta]